MIDQKIVEIETAEEKMAYIAPRLVALSGVSDTKNGNIGPGNDQTIFPTSAAS